MRNSYATAVPVTGQPLPAEVRAAIHEVVRNGGTDPYASPIPGDPDLYTVRFVEASPQHLLVEVGA